MPQSGPNFAGTVTDRNDGTGGSPAGGSWASIPSVQADDGTVATWTKPATAGVVGDALELSGFGTFTGVGVGYTINFVRVTVESTQANTTRMDPFQVQLWDGTKAGRGGRRRPVVPGPDRGPHLRADAARRHPADRRRGPATQGRRARPDRALEAGPRLRRGVARHQG